MSQEKLLERISADFRETGPYTGRRTMTPRVREAMASVPRHEFVDHRDRSVAYANRPLSIGHGQTISQPFIVALMTDLLDLEPDSRVLEIGTGSGYQAAVLAALVEPTVHTVEIIEPLAERARRRLAALGYDNVAVHVGDGNEGWPDGAPYDAIIVTAAGRLPPALVEQLAPDGRMVIPIERGLGDQMLTLVTRNEAGEAVERDVLPVRFVPLVDGD
ncbi:MAG: protein-L-isoaspartate(D-aspartate) O-methyltransferase [Gammaproteobacteria bacterium]